MDDLSHGIVASQELREHGDLDQADDALKAVVNTFCPQRIGRVRSDVLDAVSAASRDPRSFAGISSSLMSALEGVGHGLCEVKSWFVLTRVLAAHRFFEGSWITRDNARKAALQATTSPGTANDPQVLFSALRASLDLGDLELARHFRKVLGRMATIPPVDSYMCLCSGEDGPSLLALEGAEGVRSPRFERLVRRRTVAVVGPAPFDTPRGEEIDGSDVVVRINHWGDECLPPSEFAGSRTDISYYNSAMGSQLTESRSRRFLRGLKFLVFKNSDHSLGSSSRTACSPLGVFFTGHPNMIPVVVFDLLQFAPARIKLYGVNFFLSERTHHDGYIGCPVSGGTAPWSLAEHDLCSQVNFMRGLAQAGLVEVDGRGAEALVMHDREYLRRMEQVYAPV